LGAIKKMMFLQCSGGGYLGGQIGDQNAQGATVTGLPDWLSVAYASANMEESTTLDYKAYTDGIKKISFNFHQGSTDWFVRLNLKIKDIEFQNVDDIEIPYSTRKATEIIEEFVRQAESFFSSYSLTVNHVGTGQCELVVAATQPNNEFSCDVDAFYKNSEGEYILATESTGTVLTKTVLQPASPQGRLLGAAVLPDESAKDFNIQINDNSIVMQHDGNFPESDATYNITINPFVNNIFTESVQGQSACYKWLYVKNTTAETQVCKLYIAESPVHETCDILLYAGTASDGITNAPNALASQFSEPTGATFAQYTVGAPLEFTLQPNECIPICEKRELKQGVGVIDDGFRLTLEYAIPVS